MNVIPQFVMHLNSMDTKLITPTIRVVGNILAGDDRMTQMCIDAGAIPYLENLLASSNQMVVKETLWCLSNIAAGDVSQIQVDK